MKYSPAVVVFMLVDLFDGLEIAGRCAPISLFPCLIIILMVILCDENSAKAPWCKPEVLSSGGELRRTSCGLVPAVRQE